MPSVGSFAQSQSVQTSAEAEAVTKLTGELNGMMIKLRAELQTQEIAKLKAAQAAQPASDPAPLTKCGKTRL